MNSFVESLRKEHAQIKESLQGLSEIDLSSNEARERLVGIRNIFIDHLQKEDEIMYPRLREASLKDEHLKDILNYLEGEIELISQFVSIFFDKYSKKGFHEGFEREFNLICSTLIKRIDREEEVFFPELEKITK